MLDATFSLCSNFLKAHTPGFLNTPPSGQPPSLATADARMIHGKTFAEIMAEPNSALEDFKRQIAMLENLDPYR